jgi:hypothetical protein
MVKGIQQVLGGGRTITRPPGYHQMNPIKLGAFAAVVYLLCHPSHATTRREDSQYWADHVDCERYPDPDMCKMVRSATQFLLAEPESEPIDARVRVCANKIGSSIGLAGVAYGVIPPAKNDLELRRQAHEIAVKARMICDEAARDTFD